MSDTSEQTASAGGDPNFRPLTRSERRTIWLQEYEKQDIALQSWARLVEQGLEVEVMLQMHGLLVFGVMVSTETYARFYIDLYEETYRAQAPEAADLLRDYYRALVPAPDQPEIGPEGLPMLFRYIHLRNVTIMNAGHQVTVPYWRGKLYEIEAFVIGVSASQ